MLRRQTREREEFDPRGGKRIRRPAASQRCSEIDNRSECQQPPHCQWSDGVGCHLSGNLHQLIQLTDHLCVTRPDPTLLWYLMMGLWDEGFAPFLGQDDVLVQERVSQLSENPPELCDHIALGLALMQQFGVAQPQHKQWLNELIAQGGLTGQLAWRERASSVMGILSGALQRIQWNRQLPTFERIAAVLPLLQEIHPQMFNQPERPNENRQWLREELRRRSVPRPPSNWR